MRRSDIERLLPAVYQSSIHPEEPLFALLTVMEALHAPSEEALRGLDGTLDPRRAGDRFVPFLATWVDLAWLWTDREATDSIPPRSESAVLEQLGRLRELVASATYLSQWRGTKNGLVTFLERATGVSGFAVEETVPGQDDLPRPFHLRIEVPESASTPGLRALITRIVEKEKPAYATYDLSFSNQGQGS